MLNLEAEPVLTDFDPLHSVEGIELNGIPAIHQNSIVGNTREEAVDLICKQLKEDLLDSKVHRYRISWLTNDTDGMVNTQTYMNDCTLPNPTKVYGNRAEIPMRDYCDGASLYQRLANQVQIQACTFTNSEGKEEFDVSAGDPESQNSFSEVLDK